MTQPPVLGGDTLGPPHLLLQAEGVLGGSSWAVLKGACCHCEVCPLPGLLLLGALTLTLPGGDSCSRCQVAVQPAGDRAGSIDKCNSSPKVQEDLTEGRWEKAQTPGLTGLPLPDDPDEPQHCVGISLAHDGSSGETCLNPAPSQALDLKPLRA